MKGNFPALLVKGCALGRIRLRESFYQSELLQFGMLKLPTRECAAYHDISHGESSEGGESEVQRKGANSKQSYA